MRWKFWNVIFFIGLSLLLTLILAISSQLELPAPTGPYVVGRRVYKWVDTSRPEVLTEDANDVREVVVMVWYPAEPGTGVNAGYFPNLSLLSEALMQSDEMEWWQVFGLRFIRSEARVNASPVKEGPFPVVILSPGNGTNVEFYSSLASEIASHGYIVFGLNHAYDVPAVELTNGKIALYDKDQWSLDVNAHQAYTGERIKVRTADVLYVLEQLYDMNSSGPFGGLMDLNSVAIVGHSLGGITASEACKADARFKACLNFDGMQKAVHFPWKKPPFHRSNLLCSSPRNLSFILGCSNVLNPCLKVTGSLCMVPHIKVSQTVRCFNRLFCLD
jgi:predicted dienelactone hydrolase